MNIYKTMYHAPRPEGIERRKAYIVGGGIAGLATAAPTVKPWMLWAATRCCTLTSTAMKQLADNGNGNYAYVDDLCKLLLVV